MFPVLGGGLLVTKVVGYGVFALAIAIPSFYAGYRLGAVVTENQKNSIIDDLNKSIVIKEAEFRQYRDEQEKIASALELSAAQAATKYTREMSRVKKDLSKASEEYTLLLKTRGETGCVLSSAAVDTVNGYVRQLSQGGH